MPEKFLKNIQPREYQKKIFLSCTKKNCLVVLPTGLGKTLIALMLAIHRLKEFPHEKVLFLAPTRPLAEQHLNYFKKHLSELFASITLFTGKVNQEKRKNLWNVSDIIFSTPQCIANDLRKKLYTLEDVCLLIQDEAHRCLKNYDYNFIAQQYMKNAIHPRILGLTASPGSEKEKIKEICKNLSIEEVELRTRQSDDVKEYLQELKFEKIAVSFPKEFEEIRQVLIRLFNSYIDELKSRNLLFGSYTKIDLINLQKKLSANLFNGNKNFNYIFGVMACAQAIKLQHALELLETQTLKGFNNYLKELFNQAAKKQSKGVVKLVSKPEFNFIFSSSNELLAKNIEHPKLSELEEIIKKELSKSKKMKIIVFSQFRDTVIEIAKRLNSIEGINAKIFVGQAKKPSGTAGEKIGLSQKEQKKIIQEFSEGKINVLVCTSIAEEGLDIPEVNLVVFYEPVPSAIRSIQRAGRTARLMSGKIIILMTKKTRDETFFYVSRRKEKKMQNILRFIKEDISNKDKKTVQKTLDFKDGKNI